MSPGIRKQHHRINSMSSEPLVTFRGLVQLPQVAQMKSDRMQLFLRCRCQSAYTGQFSALRVAAEYYPAGHILQTAIHSALSETESAASSAGGAVVSIDSVF